MIQHTEGLIAAPFTAMNADGGVALSAEIGRAHV